MRRGLLAVAVLIASVAGSQLAQARGERASTASVTKLGTLKIELPDGGRGQIWQLVLKVNGKRGEVGSLSVRVLNDTSLPGGIRSIAMVTPAHSSRKSATFKVFVAINNLAGLAGTASVSFEKVEVSQHAEDFALENAVGMKLTPTDCAEAVAIGNRVDSYAADGNVTSTPDHTRYGPYVLYRERDATTQPSSDESVLDNTIRAQCPSTPGLETMPEGPSSFS